MSVEWHDNFSQYGTSTSNMLDGLYASIGSGTVLATDPDGVSGGKVLGPKGVRRVFSSQLTTVIVPLRLYMTELPTSRYGLFALRDDTNTSQIVVAINSVGSIEVWRATSSASGPWGDATRLIAQTTVPCLVAGSWIHFEGSFTAGNASDGSFEIRIAEEEDTLSATAVNMSHVSSPSTYFSQIVFASSSASDGGTGQTSNELYIKDVRPMNTSGSVNNDFGGDYEVVTLFPDGDDTFTGWASTAANGWSTLDETTPSDLDYITADPTDTTGAIFTLTDLDPDVTTVASLETVVRCLKTDGGTASVQAALISAGDYDNGADHAVATSATYYTDVSELSPDTAAAWTPTEVNAAKLSIDRTA